MQIRIYKKQYKVIKKISNNKKNYWINKNNNKQKIKMRLMNIKKMMKIKKKNLMERV